MNSNANTVYRSSAAHSTATRDTITSISNSADYVWREQAIFRHALPEGLLYPHLPRDGDTHSTDSSSSNINSSSTEDSSFPTLNLSLYHPSDCLVVSIFERTFFSDHKLGEVEIPLDALTDKK